MQFSAWFLLSTFILDWLLLTSCVVFATNSNQLRCGTKEESDPSESTSITDRHTTTTSPHQRLPKKLTPKFRKSNISWKIAKYPEEVEDHPTRDDIDVAATTAFQLWSSACNLNFYQTESQTPDIELKFESPRLHNSYCLTNFAAREYAHYVQTSKNPAKIHINDNVDWTTERSNSTADKVNLVYVIAHEIGHVLGFAHNNLSDSIMLQNYYNYHSTAAVELSRADTEGAKMIYGERQPSNCAKPMPIAPRYTNRRRYSHGICMQIYDLENCNGNMLNLGQVAHMRLQNVAKPTGGNRSNQVSSIRLASNCRIFYCKGDRSCEDATNRSPNFLALPKLNDPFDNQITAISCACKPCKRVEEATFAVISSSCAVGYNVPHPMCYSNPLYIAKGSVQMVHLKSLNSFIGQIASIQVHPGCVLQLCLSKQANDRTCISLEGGRIGNNYQLINNYYNGLATCNCTTSGHQ